MSRRFLGLIGLAAVIMAVVVFLKLEAGASRPCDYSIRLVDTQGGHETFGEYPLNVNL